MAKKIAKLSDLQPDLRNANDGSERGRYLIETSLREVGAGRSIVVDKEGRVIAGNKTLEAWAEMGGEVEIVSTDGRKLIVVQRQDLDLDDDTGPARKLAYYDNRTQQVDLEWSSEQLLADLEAGLNLGDMFFDNEIDDILAAAQVTEIGEAKPHSGRYVGEKAKQIKPVLYVDEIADFERAIQATGNRNRGAALLEICRYY